MDVLGKLATSLNRKDEVPNIELAIDIAKKKDINSIKELVQNLSNKSKDIRHDCIKVLYEIGGIEPGLISDYADAFLDLLDSKDNRMQWGGMTALDAVAKIRPEYIAGKLPRLKKAVDSGSVITRDQFVNILITLYKLQGHEELVFTQLFIQLETCPHNQFPMYTERALPVIDNAHRKRFMQILSNRLRSLSKESQRRRIEKVIRKL